MPPIGTFKHTTAYFATLAREQAHATKHPDRLDRKHPGKSQERYSREEIMAEVTAGIVLSRLGVACNYEQSAAYLAHWIKIVQI